MACSTYLKALRDLKVEPNFWCSEEYLEKSGCREAMLGMCVTVMDGDQHVFPPLYIGGGYSLDQPYGPIWSDFVGFETEALKAGWTRENLDLEYIFNPVDFVEMGGGRWMTFRKNSRKWGRRNEEWGYGLTTTPVFPPGPLLDDLLVDWLGTLGEDIEVYDDSVMLQYLYNGENRKALWNREGKLMGVNIWDHNWKYINFRYCICRPEPFLAEFMRWLFYTDPEILGAGRFVNDGGVLDRPSLKAFKDKMNPVRVRQVCSWKRNTQTEQHKGDRQ